jgi:hypothetical protein
VCPRCRQNAPLVYRGVSAYCTACGAPRMPLASSSVNLAGQPSKVGGTVARAIGWLVGGGGWFLALFSAWVLTLLGGSALAAGILFGLIALPASILAWVLLRSGKELRRSGDTTEQATKNQAMFALANTRGGVLTAWDVSQALGVIPQEADAILTRLAKEHPDYVQVDIDDNGTVLFRFTNAQWNAMHWHAMYGQGQGQGQGQRVDAAAPARVAEGAGASVRVEEREPLEEEVAAPAPPARQAR